MFPLWGGWEIKKKEGEGGDTDRSMVGTGNEGTHQEVTSAGSLARCSILVILSDCIRKHLEVSEVSYVVEGSTRQRKVSVVRKCIQHAQVDVNLDGQLLAMQINSSISSIFVKRENHPEREYVSEGSAVHNLYMDSLGAIGRLHIIFYMS